MALWVDKCVGVGQAKTHDDECQHHDASTCIWSAACLFEPTHVCHAKQTN